jgi:hypothetical protein
MNVRTLLAPAAMLGLLATSIGVQAQNVIPSNWTLVSSLGFYSLLRPDSPWGPGSTPASRNRIVDGVFAPENQQWNNGSWWWDEDLSVNPDIATYERPMGADIFLNAAYTVNRFVIQADDNDTYRVEYWDGSAWQLAWNVPAVNTFGLTTRDSGLLATPITTSQFRLYATGGDLYYGISEFQAFAVPEPGTWAMMALGLAGIGTLVSRRRRRD